MAAIHPDLAGRIEAEVQRLRATRSVLVHGDFSPKNLVAYEGRMMMLDFEVAHWGDPAFHAAFLLSPDRQKECEVHNPVSSRATSWG